MKIALTLTEIQKLQEVAKDHPVLAAVLEKFAPYIEIKVSFLSK